MVKEKSSFPSNKQLVGKVIHYFNKIKVAVIKFSKPMKVGDNLRIIGGEETDFEQEIKSMEIDHEKTTKAKAKAEVGLKTKKKVREGYKVYKI
ncbi:MAG: hypothetical protein ABH919_04070 [bacterium]